MTRLFALTGLALAVSLTVTAPAGARAPGANAKNTKHHAHHLLQAEKDLTAAEAAITQQNLPQAHKDVAAAIRQVEEAIHHHHKHHISQPTNSGLTGTFHRAHHQHHHSLLHKAVAEMRAAEKQLKAGNGAAASRDIQVAQKTIASAIASHHQLIGR
ncbi:hypothetical protein [Frigoriglobus tundricola]|uniref:Small metal-binding protein n=1 Tax=Frigoriglobus tundricola TaxID=2774151 RepID=A0A6M5YJN9_9BACT|nr:hypothetical protein [Frigoriglobus tundricola]QJW93521.1 hypothetical protein FTUN_1028 [Frigoriglobus tundricola]